MTDGGHWAELFRAELAGNILPFWRDRVADRQRGGFHGAMDSEGRLMLEADRGVVLNTRILWTFSAAARLVDPAWREPADWACDYLTAHFVDPAHDGLVWMVSADGRPVSARKQIYAQAFGIYAFAEHHRATGRPQSLELAERLFRLIERHAYDAAHGGYFEARDRDWTTLSDVRLSDKDLNSPKSMNTHLHVLEAYTNLVRVWPDPLLMARLKELVQLMMDRLIENGHFILFVDADWKPQSDHISYGHDIEGSWLLVEAARIVGDAALASRARHVAMTMARAVLNGGIDHDGSLFFEADAKGDVVDADKHWWVQAEAVIGFYNAYQLSGDPRFISAARKAWDYVDARLVDRSHGEWRAKLTRTGEPLSTAQDPDAVLVGPWKCPYHNARLCYEMIERLTEQQTRKRAP